MSSLYKIEIPEQKIIDGIEFPLVLAPDQSLKTIKDTIDFVKTNLNKILEELKTHGAILFRGFPIQDPKDFNDFSLAFGWKDLPYIGGAAVRKNVYGVVFTSNEAPPDQLIPFHHEMAQVPKFPSNLFFYCDVKPQEGGETPLCLSNAVYEKISEERPEFVEKLKQKGVKYTRVIPEEDDPSSPIGRGWKSTFLTDDKRVAEERCLADGGSFEWLPNNNLKTVSKVLDAVRLEERTGKMTWFNSIVAVYYGWRDSRNSPEKAITYGDGSSLDASDVERCSQILDEFSVAFEWQKNDVVLVDNKLALHARNSYTPPRRILAALFQ